jgi:hypothetical protein
MPLGPINFARKPQRIRTSPWGARFSRTPCVVLTAVHAKQKNELASLTKDLQLIFIGAGLLLIGRGVRILRLS